MTQTFKKTDLSGQCYHLLTKSEILLDFQYGDKRIFLGASNLLQVRQNSGQFTNEIDST